MKEVLVAVDPAKLDQIWPHAAHFLQAAYMTGLGDDTVESLKVDLDAGHSLLWVVWDGSGILAAVTTKLVTAPAKKLCVITACGGRELHRWKQLITELEQYAKHEQCDALRIMGRPGWKVIFADYREPWVCLEKDLK